MADDDVTGWLDRLAKGDQAAAQAIWERYFQKLVRLARTKLEGLPRRVADEEDVALSAIKSFYRGVAAGRFPQLNDRHDLWRLLVTITAHKALAQIKRERAQKRGGGAVKGESAFARSDGSDAAGGIAQVVGREPTPQFASMLAENWQLLLKRLHDETLKTVALYKMESYTVEEIAEKLGRTTRTVERKLMRIRQIWQRREP